MTVETDRQTRQHIRDLAAADDRDGLDAVVRCMGSSEAIRAILRLEPDDRLAVLGGRDQHA